LINIYVIKKTQIGSFMNFPCEKQECGILPNFFWNSVCLSQKFFRSFSLFTTFLSSFQDHKIFMDISQLTLQILQAQQCMELFLKRDTLMVTYQHLARIFTSNLPIGEKILKRYNFWKGSSNGCSAFTRSQGVHKIVKLYYTE